MSGERRPALLVTGGSRGIGAAVARLAATEGYDVCLSYRAREDEATAVCADIRAAGGQALAVRADMSSEDDVLAMWQAALQGLGRVDVLVNNAGMLEQQMPLAEMSAARLTRMFAVNAIGALLCAREAVRHMSVQRGGQGGAIVNVSSIAARTGAPGEYVDYAAAKAAIDALTVGLAREVATDGIRVNCVRPGSVHTDIHALGGEPDRVSRVSRRIPMGRGGQPDELAEAVLWLASPRASYVTGSILDVGGGL